MIAGVDWSAPWYRAWRVPGQEIAAAMVSGQELRGALNDAGACPVRFVAQSALPEDMAYEQFIFERHECPTRDTLHDFFNGLCWLRLPRTKARMNALQAEQIARAGIGARRGPVRDAVTLLDENGALLDAPQPLWDALLERNWRRLFVDLRPLWAQARVLVIGHALLEKLAQPRKDLTAHLWCEPADLSSLAAADAWLAQRCTADRLAAKPYTPLPVLGIPGWWTSNENFSFYGDSWVFRPPRPRPGQNRQPPAGS